MAWQNIAASETDANSPLNQTLMDKIRGNLEDLHGRAEGARSLLALGGKCYQGGSWAYPFEAYAQNVVADPGPIILEGLAVYVPIGVTELRVRPYCKSNSQATSKLTVTVGSASVDLTALPASYAWMSEAVIIGPGEGWKDVSVRASETGSGSIDIYLAGLVIRAA